MKILDKVLDFAHLVRFSHTLLRFLSRFRLHVGRGRRT